MAHERKLDANFRREWDETNRQRRQTRQHVPAPERQHTFPPTYGFTDTPSVHKPMPIEKAAKRAGEYGYKRRIRELKKRPPPDVIMLDMNPSLAAQVNRKATLQEWC